jgi:hypothetical protein
MNVIDLLRKHGIEPKKASGTKGGEYASACPGCGGDDRFRIWPDQNEGQGGFWCRQCGKKGDAIQFLRDFDGLSFQQACERLGRKLPDSRDLHSAAPRKAAADWTPRDPEAPGPAWQEHAKKLITWAFEQLMVNPEQLGWLSARGITEAAAVRFGLGWVPEDLYRSREAWGLPEIKNEKTGKVRPLWIPRGLMIPWFAGVLPIRIRIRRPDPVEFGPRYYMMPSSASVTMLLRHHENRHHPKTGLIMPEVYVVVESELDAIMLNCQCLELCGAVALGSNSAHPDVAATKILSGASVILNALDFDAAGASERDWWPKHFPKSRRWPVPRGKDPGDAYKAGVNIREWVTAGLPEGLRK